MLGYSNVAGMSMQPYTHGRRGDRVETLRPHCCDDAGQNVAAARRRQPRISGQTDTCEPLRIRDQGASALKNDGRAQVPGKVVNGASAIGLDVPITA